MKQAEVDLKEHNYRECQIGCRKALYLVFEKQFDIRSFEKYEEDIQNINVIATALFLARSNAPEYAKNKKYIKEKVKEPTDFIVVDYNELWRNLLSNGIDLVSFSNVRLLTPKVYLFEEEDWVIKEDVRGIMYNQENAEYCFRKTIEILLIEQKNSERKKSISASIAKHITIKNKEISILQKASLSANVKYKLKRDLQYTVYFLDEVRGLDSKNKYYHILAAIKEKDKEERQSKYTSGYILKKDINQI